MRPEEEHKDNSPWNTREGNEPSDCLQAFGDCLRDQILLAVFNIASDFDVDMSFSPVEIKHMLEDYEGDHGTGMKTETVAQEIYDYTEGYPYLVSVGTMFGFLKDDVGQVAISNRIFEIWLYNLFIAEEAIDSKTYDAGQKGKDKFIKKDGLDIELILKKFVQHFTEVYGNSSETFVEKNGRKLFLLYIRPLINGTGNYYIESRTRSMGRTDLIIDYQGQQYIIEMKIWHGEEYNKRGEEQLIGYLNDYHLSLYNYVVKIREERENIDKLF